MSADEKKPYSSTGAQTNDRAANGKKPPIWLIVFAMVLPTIVTWVYFVLVAKQPQSIQKTTMSIAKIVQFGLPIYWVIAIRRYWPNWRTSPKDSMLLMGLISGLVIFATALALYFGWLQDMDVLKNASSQINERVDQMGFKTPLAFIGLGIFYVLVHSLLEEYYWRWFVFGMLRERVKATSAMWISSIGFMSHHVIVLAQYFELFSIGTAFFSACVAVGGLLWSWMYHRTGKLHGAWLSHALVDAVIFTIGYTMLTWATSG